MEDDAGDLALYYKSAKTVFKCLRKPDEERREFRIVWRAALYLLHQVIFLTRRGRLGRGTETVKEGDIIVLLAGDQPERIDIDM